jgi:hypothetical protein
MGVSRLTGQLTYDDDNPSIYTSVCIGSLSVQYRKCYVCGSLLLAVMVHPGRLGVALLFIQ